MKNINKIVLSLFALLIFSPVFSQKKTVTLNLGNLGNALKAAPMETSQAAKTMPLILNLPMATADERAFRVVESPIMAPDFAAAYPSFRTYAIQAVDDPSVTGRISITPFGFNGVILTLEGMVVIRPLDLLNPIEHEVSLSNFSAEEFLCDVDETITSAKGSSGTEKMAFTNGSTKRTYSLAIVCTGEFHNANGGSIAAASAVVTSSVNGIQAIYERELAVNFQLLTPFIYTNPATDPFNAGLNRTLEAAQAVEANFPGGNYDVGHVFHDQDEPPAQLPGGGVAFLNAVCVNSPVGTGFLKGGGWSGSFDNVSAGWIKLATHEFGHMFGMPHTFNGTGGSCTSNIDDDNSYEIASGNSIMSYNGICGAGQNIPDGGTADHYFHYNSLDKAVAHMNAQSCHTGTATGNSPPTVNANACGGPYTIPKSTPFRLTGSGTDPDGDQIYYSWEQYDEDGAGMTPTQGFIGATAGASSIAPLFRSYPPVTTPTRLFPNMNLVAAGSYSSDFEPLPSVARTLNFRLTGRDWKMGGGGIHSSELAVTVSNNGPFSVTAPNGGETIAAGSNTTVTWNVNGTNAFCTNVNIRLSIDGGLTFPYLLLASTPNDGSQSVTLPTGVTGSTTARVMVECADNTCVVFFDISNNNFTVTSACSAAGSNICPTTAMTLPVGDPGLNLNLSRHFGTSVTQRTFSITNASPTGPLANATVQGGNVCQTPWGNEKFDTFDFAVETSGSYTLSNISGGQIIFSVFVAAGYNPAMPCSSTFLGSNATGAISWFSSATVTLNACTVYKVVVWTLGNANATPTLTISGTGTVYASGAGPGANYSYTYVAVNTANSQIAAVSATSNFTALGAGSYQIYGASYYSGAGPNPPTVNPATWVGQTISAILSGGACALFSTNFKSLTITPPGGTPNVAISGNPSLNEGNAGPTAFTFTVTRTGNNANQSTVNWAVTGSGANPANAADFTGGTFPSGTVTFPAGSSANQTITVNVNGDTDAEPNEGFTVTLSNPVNATITTATATGTIVNDDGAAAYCAAGATNTSEEKISNVQFNTINNPSTSTAGYEDFTAISTTVAQGSTHAFTGTISNPFSSDEIIVWIDFNKDNDFEDAGEEVFNSPTGVGPHTGNITIPANAMTGNTRMRVRLHDTQNGPNSTPCGNSTWGQVEDYTINITGTVPSIAISGSPSMNEGNAGPTAFTFTVTRTGNIANQSSASWAVTGSGGNPANGADFTGGNFPSGTVTFPAGSNATQTITVNVNGDTDVEPNEGFTVTLSNPVNATITTATASGTILNDDAAPGYCAAGATSTGFEKISNVQFNTINNPSTSTAGYEDFTAVSTTVAQGSTYTFTGTISTGYAEDEIIVWIDFNQDQDFDDPGEEVFNSPTGVGPHSGPINIPANAMTGNTRMRVRLHDTANGPNATPCGNSTYGQVEDYSINITTGNNCPTTLSVPGTIASGTYQASMTVTSNGTVPNGNTVIFKAGTDIELQPYFEVQLGGVLTTLIEGCTPFAPPAPQGNGDQ